MIENALKDPASLQRLLQNPMVANMARANPQLIEGACQRPEVQAAMQQHPEMREQVERLIGRSLPVPANSSPAPGPGMQSGNFENELLQLSAMGFNDRAACIN